MRVNIQLKHLLKTYLPSPSCARHHLPPCSLTRSMSLSASSHHRTHTRLSSAPTVYLTLSACNLYLSLSLFFHLSLVLSYCVCVFVASLSLSTQRTLQLQRVVRLAPLQVRRQLLIAIRQQLLRMTMMITITITMMSITILQQHLKAILISAIPQKARTAQVSPPRAKVVGKLFESPLALFTPPPCQH